MAYPKYLFNALLANAPNPPIKDSQLEKPVLLKCKYPISIYTELKLLFASDDYFSGLRYFFGSQPLEDVPENEKTREEIIITENQGLDGKSEFLVSQPHLKKLKQGTEDLQDFTVDFLYNNPKIRCKEGFADLLLANFAKYNNPSKFSEHRIIFESDVAPCVAYEDESFCPPLPMDAYEFIAEAGKMAFQAKDNFKIVNHEGE